MVRRSSSRSWIEPERLVHEQHLRPCASARARLPAAGCPPDSSLGSRSSIPSSATSRNSSLRRARRSPRTQRRAPKRELDVVCHGHVAKKSVVLEYEAHLPIAGRDTRDVPAVQGDAAVIDLGEAGDGPQQRLLPLPLGPSSTRNSPGSILSETSLTTGTDWYLFVTW